MINKRLIKDWQVRSTGRYKHSEDKIPTRIDPNGLDGWVCTTVCPSDQICRWNWRLNTCSLFGVCSKIVKKLPKSNRSVCTGHHTDPDGKISTQVDWNRSDSSVCPRVCPSNQDSGQNTRVKVKILDLLDLCWIWPTMTYCRCMLDLTYRDMYIPQVWFTYHRHIIRSIWLTDLLTYHRFILRSI